MALAQNTSFLHTVFTATAQRPGQAQHSLVLGALHLQIISH